MACRSVHLALVTAVLAGTWLSVSATHAAEGSWKRIISYQDKRDLFANYYVGPWPSGTAAQMYVSPLPVPEHVGHTYVTYQPLMPHEFLYKHTRSHYAHTPGAGWYRSKTRCRTCGLRVQDVWHNLCPKY